MTLSRLAFNRVWRSRFARDVVVVACGTVGAQAVNMIYAPLITRLYGPDAFGMLGIFAATVSVAVPIAALAYPIAIVLPRHDCDALGLVRLSMILSFGVAALTAVLLAFFGEWLMGALGTDSLIDYLMLIPLAMLFAAWMQVAQHWLIRKKQFVVIARSAIAHSLILNNVKSGIGFVHPIGGVLIVMVTVGHALHAAMLFLGAREREQIAPSQTVQSRPAPLRELVCLYRDFPLYRAPQNFLNAVSQSIPVLMLATLFGPAAAGFYTLSKMVMGMPSTLIGKAIQDVFYPRITATANDGENLTRHIVQATGVLLVIGLIPFTLVFLFGPWLFGLVFGAQWTMAGDYARWLAPFFLFNFLNKPAVAAVPVLGIQRGLLVYELLSTGAKVMGLFIGFYWFESELWAVALFAIIGALAYAAMMFWIMLHAARWKKNEKTS